MTGDHHGQAAGTATLLVRAADGLLGTHRLITMDTERPFGFLDDRLAAGDSLLGLVSLEQLESLHVDAKEGRRLHHGTLDFASEWRDKLAQAADLRRKITATGGVTIRDIEHKARLLEQAEKLSGEITTVADAITATGLANAKLKGRKLDQAFLPLGRGRKHARHDSAA
jgi:hypothetical protein